jgi:glycosyltransferase involved in cell wall biosynthesis
MSRTASSEEVWVVIPALNEAPTLRTIVLGCLAAVHHVVVVNDGSTDGGEHSLGDLPVTVLHNMKQCGKAHSLWRGFRHALAAGATAIVTLDADGQHAPPDIMRFLTLQSCRPEALIVGVRAGSRARQRPLRYLANRLADLSLGWLAGQTFLDSQSGYRLYPARLLNRLHTGLEDGDALSLRESFVFESEILLDSVGLGCPVLWVSLTATAAPEHRASHFRPLADSYFIARRIIRRICNPALADALVDDHDSSHPARN